MKEKFKFEVTDWVYVDESGYPEEDDWCLLVCKDSDGEYFFFVGGYNESEKAFYVNFGLGGAITDAADVVAWAPLDKEDFLKII